MTGNIIKVYEPRWHDRTVLIAKYKVKPGMNLILFTKTKAFKDMFFAMSGKEIMSYPVESNGTIDCYAVPLGVVLDNKVEEEA